LEGFFKQYIGLYRPIMTALNALLAKYQLSYSLWQVIYYIKKVGPSTLVEISNYYNIEKPSITRRVHRLLELDIVKQIPGKDKREKVIELTEVGEDIYLKCRKAITELENRLMDGMDHENQVHFYKTIQHLKERIMQQEEKKSESI